MNYWLVKSEPHLFSIETLKQKKISPWDGVRNYQARNFMRDQMEIDDLVLFYHSSCDIPGIAGLCKVASSPYPDPSQFDKKSPYFDEKSTKEKPRWFLVDMKYVETFARFIPLSEIKKIKGLEKMIVLQKGTRLSITPVTPKEFQILLEYKLIG